MKLFSFDRYSKPGKGVEKNEKPKPAFIRFFIVLWTKRWKIMGVNFIFVLFSLLAPVLAYLAFSGCITLYNGFTGSELFNTIDSDPMANELYWKILFFFIAFVTSVPVFAVGPLRAGFTYIFKSFYKEEPCFIWSDFITKSRSNRSLGIKTCLTLFFGALMVMLCGTATYVLTKPEYNLPFLFCFIEWAVIIFFGVLLLMMSLYVYPMMVTFNVSFKQLFKNSFILCVVKWFRNILILLLDALVIALPLLILPTTNYVVFVFMIIAYMAVVPGLVAEINMFAVYPVLKKYMIDNPEADKSENKGSGEDEKPQETKTSGGRFENGMWIED